MNKRDMDRNKSFDYDTYVPNAWDIIYCGDESVFLITNGKFFGPTAYVLYGATFDSSMAYLKYQAFSLEEVVSIINKHHDGVKDVERGFFTALRRILQIQLGFYRGIN